MAWAQRSENEIVFDCDTCDISVSIDLRLIRKDSNLSAFINAWRHLEALDWTTWKRISRPWSQHCANCKELAESQHYKHKRDEHERDRIRARATA